jgi:hypothetical protein
MNRIVLYAVTIVIVIGLVAGAFVMYRQTGPLSFTLVFDDGKGIQPGQFVVYKGVRIGEVKSVDLKDSQANVGVQIYAAQRKTAYKEASFRIAQRDLVSGEHEIIMEDAGDVRTAIEQNSVLRGREGIIDSVIHRGQEWLRQQMAPTPTQTSK